ncbi:hypothetical protein HAX54_048158 [Datura stramonium]|uniref:Wall-associated receptor kinase galacturonan-binding domain-containing protein n=1 Tax=Datura stramonium TaxID=4076 RepID=A0ABS8STB2_DATST|nr:hypothetical protein [Datura stramonium]
MSGGTKFLLTILIFMQLSETPFAEESQQCVPSSCGHIHNISYPFRLKSDPKHCGHENYELSCEGDRAIFTILPYNWNRSLNYYVQAINYENSTIRLVDPVLPFFVFFRFLIFSFDDHNQVTQRHTALNNHPMDTSHNAGLSARGKNRSISMRICVS